ncbi:hypothetical protein Ciccas_001860 [Cichlidogyrus casuarinus]|uniref:Uncharacterized protein n=1 Tax=Cichlidogyrus casuarinus TaxID=1844966 RepID=A0ABD2QJE6_9PLAT
MLFSKLHVKRISKEEPIFQVPKIKPEQLMPSPRDKATIEYFDKKLYLFGGFGCSPRTPSDWPASVFYWPFLFDEDNEHEWKFYDDILGWNNQLLIFDTVFECWSLWKHSLHGGHAPPLPRAAHTSCMDNSYGNMFVFGGRSHVNVDQFNLSIQNGRRRDLFMFNALSLQWTEIQAQVNDPELWPPGLSWSCINHLDTFKDPRSEKFTSNLSVYGGQLNDNSSSSQVFILNVDLIKSSATVSSQSKSALFYTLKENNPIPENDNFRLEKCVIKGVDAVKPGLVSDRFMAPDIVQAICHSLQNDFLLNPPEERLNSASSDFLNPIKSLTPFQTMAELVAHALGYFFTFCKFTFTCPEDESYEKVSGIQMLSITTTVVGNTNYGIIGRSYLFDLAVLLDPWKILQMVLLESDCWIESVDQMAICDSLRDIFSDDLKVFKEQRDKNCDSLFYKPSFAFASAEYLRSKQWEFNQLILSRNLREKLYIRFQGLWNWFRELSRQDREEYKSPQYRRLVPSESIKWSPLGELPQARCWHTAVTLFDGSIISIGGQATDRSCSLDPILLIKACRVPSLKTLVEKQIAIMVLKTRTSFHDTEPFQRLHSNDLFKHLTKPSQLSVLKWL